MARGGCFYWPAAIADDPEGCVSRGARGNDHRRAPRGRAYSGRDRAAVVHRTEQPVQWRRPGCPAVRPACRYLPVRAQSLQGLAEARVDWRADHHPGGARSEHRRPDTHRPEKNVMSVAAITVPTVTHNLSKDEDLTEKISVKNLDFFYGDHRALKSINVPLYRGKVTAFIGPSGCGKPTLLRILNRMYDLYPNQRATGHVTLDSANILSPSQDLNLLRAKVGMVFQKPTPFPMTIFDNIAFGILLYEKVSRSELADRVEAALTRAALWTEVKDKLRASGLSLSGGQQQRLCIARTIAAKPDV